MPDPPATDPAATGPAATDPSATGPRAFIRAVADDRRDIGAAVAWAGRLASEAGLAADVGYAVEVGLEEALANLVVHGRTHGGPKDITVRMSIEGDTARVVVGDRCRPFDAARAAVPEAPAPGRLFEGGQGLRLLHAFASELGYESEGGENRLTMVFRPASSAAGQV